MQKPPLYLVDSRFAFPSPHRAAARTNPLSSHRRCRLHHLAGVLYAPQGSLHYVLGRWAQNRIAEVTVFDNMVDAALNFF